MGLRMKCVDCCELLHGHGNTADVGHRGHQHLQEEKVVLEELLSKARGFPLEPSWSLGPAGHCTDMCMVLTLLEQSPQYVCTLGRGSVSPIPQPHRDQTFFS